MAVRKPKPRRKARPKSKVVCRTVRDPRTGRRRRRCTRRRATARRPATRRTTSTTTRPAAAAPAALAAPAVPAPSAAQPAPAPPPAPTAAAPPPTAVAQPLPTPPAPPAPVAPPRPVAVYDGAFGIRQAERLLWRAGFGPRPGEAADVAALGVTGAVRRLTRPSGEAQLSGPEPRAGDRLLAPADVYGDDHLWWLDRMVRTDQPLVERMTLVWHDWFATSNADVNRADLMLEQNALLRRHALGDFGDLVRDVTVDRAMLLWLNGIQNQRRAPNENYARELMELFTLGADRGAYTETDVRELARALTGWRADWNPSTERFENFRFDNRRFDDGTKTLWQGTPHQRAGNFGWQMACRLCLENPYHPSFFVRKLWSAFIPTPPDAETQAALEHNYVVSGRSIREIVEAILQHPDLFRGGQMVKPPVVYAAGLLRTRGDGIASANWYWRCRDAGQRLFFPPNVSGWNDQAWLDTSTLIGRWGLAQEVQDVHRVTAAAYDGSTETADEAVDAALAFWGDPLVSAETLARLRAFAEQPNPYPWNPAEWRGQRQNALRHLLAASPDLQVC